MTPQATPGSSATEVLTPLGAVIADTIEPMFTQLQQIRRAVESIGEDGTLRTAGLEALDDAIQHALRRPGSLLHGAGFLTDADVLVDAPLGIRWWVVDATGRMTLGQHVIDPTRPDHYEYVDMEWFTRPRGGETRCLYGPYVDYGGTNEYSLTCSAPVTVAGRFIGVAAGDLGLERLESVLGPALRVGPRGAIVINAERRVILSGDPRHLAGAFLPVDDSRAEQPCGNLPWSVCLAG